MKLNRLCPFLLFFLLVICSDICFASDENKNEVSPNKIAIEQLKKEIKLTKEVLEEVRRDQLNYRIEKDLLKEAYSSNLQTINTVIAIILAILTIIGLFGIKSIDSIKKEFQKELEETRKLRQKYENQFAQIEAEQKDSKEQFEELRVSTEDQGKRLKILEIQEKASSLMNSKDYPRALKYLSVGLELDPSDGIMLRQKMDCLGFLARFPEAMETGKLILEKEPDSVNTIVNLAEMYLITKNIPGYDKVYEQFIKVNHDAVKEGYSDFLFWYFELLKCYAKGDLDALVGHINKLISEKPTETKERIARWRFDELRSVFQSDEDKPLKAHMFKSIDFLEGKIDISELEDAIK